MAKMNFQVLINAYSDKCQTSTPALSNFKWSRQINGIPFTTENDQQIQVLPGITTQNIVPYPFSNATNSGNATADGTNLLTISGSTTGIAPGNLIVGVDIAVGTTVESILGQVVTMSQPSSGSGTQTATFYFPTSFFYLECDQQVSVIYNNGTPVVLNPIQVNGSIQPAVFMMASPVYSLIITNLSVSTANVFFASVG